VTGPYLEAWHGRGPAVLTRWLVRRHATKVLNPAYLAVGDTTVTVFSARFGPRCRGLGPYAVWLPHDIADAAVRGNGFRVTFRPAASRRLLDLEAVEPGPEAARGLRYLCAKTTAA
jgi:hypothetical protein